MKAAIVSIGDELTLGQIIDTNAPWLAGRLVQRGILSPLQLTVPDDRLAITAALQLAIKEADLILVTGGLGPTDDDLTRYAMADILGSSLELDKTALRQIDAFFQGRTRVMPQRNQIQAMCPVGAKLLDNPVGTAPGIHAHWQGRDIFCVPGVPVEMKELYDRHIEPWLSRHTTNGSRYLLTAKLNTFGTGESNIADLLGDLMNRQRNPLVGTTVSQGIIAVRIRSEFPTRQETELQLSETIAECKNKLGHLVFGQEDQSLQGAVVELLLAEHKTIATAESCTGGLLAAMLTEIPGSSTCFRAGYVVYANEAKTRDLEVPQHLIAQHGAVSESVAIAMAEGARTIADTDYALSITGIAGPAGGTETKPVGTVCIAMADRHNATTVVTKHFLGDRVTVRDRSAKSALDMIRLKLLDVSVMGNS